jgi:hypothetical protein
MNSGPSYNKRFVDLATRTISKTATPAEANELEHLLKAEPRLMSEFRTLRDALEDEAECDNIGLYIRVLTGTASEDERGQLGRLPTSAPDAWKRIQKFGWIVQTVYRSAPTAQPTEEMLSAPIQESARKRLLAAVKELRDDQRLSQHNQPPTIPG